MLADNAKFHLIVVVPGAIVLWIISGFKLNLNELINRQTPSKKAKAIGIICWMLVILFFFIKNNYLQ